MADLGHAELRQGPARADRPHRPRGGARALPQRARRGRPVSGSGRVWTEAELRRVCDRALRACDGDQAEALVLASTSELTRFANNVIHQNVASREAQLQLRVVAGKRVGMVRTNDLSDEGIARAARGAGEVARAVPENPELAGLPAARPLAPAPSAY
ncbi:MAG: hypothetical protein FJ028_02035, partial [Chloroflexi bacterium]|nr:hypothetical protein [Chloroflexota bacterium]